MTGTVKLLVENITTVCGEDPSKAPPHGEIHCPIEAASGTSFLPKLWLDFQLPSLSL